MNKNEPLLRVQRIQVDRLFGAFTHKVALNLEERVTILHGPNGVGKTVLLTMANALLEGKYSLFQRVPFDRFILELTDQRRVELTLGTPGPSHKSKNKKSASSKRGRQEPLKTLHIKLFEKSREVAQHQVLHHDAAIADVIARTIPWLHRHGEDLWLDEREGGIPLSPEEVVMRYGDEVGSDLPLTKRADYPDWLQAIHRDVKVHFIAAQRLLRIDVERPRRYTGSRLRTAPMVLDCAEDLRLRIRDTMARYGQRSQTLDQSFPQRLLSGNPKQLSADELKQRMERLDQRRRELKAIGLLDSLNSHPFDTSELESLESAQKSVMALYVNDTEDKLSELDSLAQRIRLLLDNLNNKFQYKEIRIDGERGLIAEGESGRTLELDALSSGEQHELVLHYDLLFRVRQNTLVLMDEPELSLHVVWQKQFLPELLEIVKAVRFDVLLATHSPFIVGEYAELMIGLDAEQV